MLDRGAPATGVLVAEERRENAPAKAVDDGVGVGAVVAKRGWGVAALPVTTGGLGVGVGRRSGPPDDDAADESGPVGAGWTVRLRPITTVGDGGAADGVGTVTLRPMTAGGDDGGPGANDGNVMAAFGDAGWGVAERAGRVTLCPMRTGGRLSTAITADGDDEASEAPSISG